MSNIFKNKNNSRFAVLFEDEDFNENIYDNKNKNKNKNNNANEIIEEKNYFKKENKTHTYKSNVHVKKEIQKDTFIQKDNINFPELINTNNNKITATNNIDFLNIFKNNTDDKKELEIKHNEDEEYINLNPGWILLKRNKITGETIIKYKPTLKENIQKASQNLEVKSDNELSYEIFKKLSELYEERTKEYIDLWGYDDWEKRFRFPNYDYEYFDKLDEKYSQELDELGGFDSEYIYSDEEFD
jgi:hypothetical protein